MLKGHTNEIVPKHIANHDKGALAMVNVDGNWVNISDTLQILNIDSDLHKVSRVVADQVDDIANSLSQAQKAFNQANQAIKDSSSNKENVNAIQTALDDLKKQAASLKDAVTNNSTALDKDSKAIALKADATTVNNLTNEIAKNTADLKVAADAIASKVTSGDVTKLLNDKGYATQAWTTSSINQKANSLTQTIASLSSDAKNAVQKVNAITSTVDGTTQRLETIENNVKTNATAIQTLNGTLQTSINDIKSDEQTYRTQTASMIQDKLITKDGLISQINQQAGDTLIEVDGGKGKLQLDADTVAFTGKAFIPDAAITDISADSITTGTLKAANGNFAMNLDNGHMEFKNGDIFSQSGKMDIDITDGRIGMSSKVDHYYNTLDGTKGLYFYYLPDGAEEGSPYAQFFGGPTEDNLNLVKHSDTQDSQTVPYGTPITLVNAIEPGEYIFGTDYGTPGTISVSVTAYINAIYTAIPKSSSESASVSASESTSTSDSESVASDASDEQPQTTIEHLGYLTLGNSGSNATLNISVPKAPDGYQTNPKLELWMTSNSVNGSPIYTFHHLYVIPRYANVGSTVLENKAIWSPNIDDEEAKRGSWMISNDILLGDSINWHDMKNQVEINNQGITLRSNIGTNLSGPYLGKGVDYAQKVILGDGGFNIGTPDIRWQYANNELAHAFEDYDREILHIELDKHNFEFDLPNSVNSWDIQADNRFTIAYGDNGGSDLQTTSAGRIGFHADTIYFDKHDYGPTHDGLSTGMWFGNFTVLQGNKNAAVKTSQGWTSVHSYETADYYFGDIGESTTDSNDQIIIGIDKLFNETVNTDIPYQVFVTPYSSAHVWVDQRLKDRFVVKSDQPNARFGWEIKAKRKGFEHTRLQKIDI